jgi:GH25 family lysozyme M1 (1,4-beta-N-acetylmuramidase)
MQTQTLRLRSLLGLPCAALVAITFGGCIADGTSPETIGQTEEAVVVCAKGATVEGIDVSVWQGSGIDWNAVHKSGRQFGIARISYGTGTIDDTFPGNWTRMKAAGMIRGAYQWFRPAQSASAQADIVIAHVGKLGPGDLPVTADVEETQGLSGAQITAALHTWMDRVEAGTGKKPIIYSGKYFWNDNVGSKDFSSYPYWIPAYGPTCPDLATAWSDWKFFQYTDKASVPGVSGGVDGDKFNGSLADLQAFAGIVSNTPPKGTLDEVSCDRIRGWAQDPDTKTSAIDVHLYFDSKPGDASPTYRPIKAGTDRSDLCTPLGSCNHAFERGTPMSLLDGKPHVVHAYAIDSGGKGPNPEIDGSPKTITCAKPALPDGVRRHVPSIAVLGAWKLDPFEDMVTVDDATLEKLPIGRDLGDKPSLINTDDPKVGVQLVDGALHRHVQSPASMDAWRFDFAAVVKWTADKYATLKAGPEWRLRPFLVKGSTAAVYLLDDRTSEDPTTPGPSGDGGPVGDAGPTGDGGRADGGAQNGLGGDTGSSGGCSTTRAPAVSSWSWLVLPALALATKRRRAARAHARRS